MFLSSVIEQVPRSLEERGGGAGHTPLPSVASEISRSLNQCRRRNAFDSALCLHRFRGLQTISGSSFQIYLLSVCCVLGVRVWRAYYWIIYLKGIWAQVREGSEGILTRWGLLVHTFYSWLFTFFNELKIKLLFPPHLLFLSTTRSQLVKQPCCSLNWLLNFTLKQTGKLYWAFTGF